MHDSLHEEHAALTAPEVEDEVEDSRPLVGWDNRGDTCRRILHTVPQLVRAKHLVPPGPQGGQE